MKRKRILCLIDSLGSGGAQRQLVGLGIMLKEKGYDVIVAAYHDNRFYVDQLLSAGVPYVYLKKAHHSVFRVWHIIRYIRIIKPDTVISYLETPSICACLAHFFNRKFKLIVSERNTTQSTGKNEFIRFKLFETANHIVPNAFSQANYIRKTFPRLSQKVSTIPNFVDLTYFHPITKENNVHSVPRVLVVATIWPSKNALGFIDAAAVLFEKGYRFYVDWYGKDYSHMDYFIRCQEKIDSFGLSEYITLKDKTTKIDACYHWADYFCLPSFYEGTPNVICEAMACGLPIVCSDVCDNSRYVKEGENGILFDPKNTASICSAFEKLLSLSEGDRDRYGQSSRRIAESVFSKEVFVNSYIKLIEHEY